jgi:hypothetical protein
MGARSLLKNLGSRRFLGNRFFWPFRDTVGEFRSGRLDGDARRETPLQTEVPDRVLGILRLVVDFANNVVLWRHP